MISLTNVKSIHIACGPTDLRKSIDGYALIIQETFHLSPFTESLFLFCNRKKDKLKIIHFEESGFWLYYKRLEQGKFKWPKHKGELKSIDQRQFRWLLEGLSIEQKSAYQKLTFTQV
jgi:transposase